MSEETHYSENDLDCMDAFATFKAALQGKNQGYFTASVEEKNATTMINWALANGMTLADAANLGFWQLSFGNTKAQLVLDEKAPVVARIKSIEDAGFRDRVAAMSVAQIKETYQTDSDFRVRYEALNGGR